MRVQIVIWSILEFSLVSYMNLRNMIHGAIKVVYIGAILNLLHKVMTPHEQLFSSVAFI